MNGLPEICCRESLLVTFSEKIEEAASEETGEIELSTKTEHPLCYPSQRSPERAPFQWRRRRWRKRKELQTLRRLEAKRKRTAKQRSYKTARGRDRDRASLEENCEEDKVVEDKPPMGRNGNHLQQPYLGMPSWTIGGFIPSKTERANGLGDGGLKGNTTPPPPPPPPPPLPPSSQGSVGSQRSSSGISNSRANQCKVLLKGVNKCSEARSPASIQSLPGQSEQKPLISPGTPEKSGKVGGVVAENQPEKPTISSRGKREVRIVCVCHGSFLSPAEFVKHAGGSDVAHLAAYSCLPIFSFVMANGQWCQKGR
ncbi:hypothetical protein AAG906_013496 [Vitis piasezkii]